MVWEKVHDPAIDMGMRVLACLLLFKHAFPEFSISVNSFVAFYDLVKDLNDAI